MFIAPSMFLRRLFKQLTQTNNNRMTQQEFDTLRPIVRQQPWATFQLLSKVTLIKGDASCGILPVRRFTFAYPATQSLSFTFTTEVLKVVRSDTGRHKSYSPTSEADHLGSFDLTVKIYPGGGHSEWLDSQSIGTCVTMFGPLPPPEYAKVYMPGKRVIAIALGIGITEVYTTCREELRKSDDTSVTLVHSVRYRDEVVLAEEVGLLEKQFKGRFDVVRVASREGEAEGKKNGEWFTGRLDAEKVDKIIGDGPREHLKILVVGTKPMMRAVWTELEKLGLEYEKYTLVRKKSRPYF